MKNILARGGIEFLAVLSKWDSYFQRITLFIYTLFVFVIVSAPLASQQKQISFSTTEGTWVSLDVAPNGKFLAFELIGDIYTLPIKGGLARPILKGNAFQSQPRFSPNGKLIVYISDESGSDNIWISKFNGLNPRKISNRTTSAMLSPAWSSDGSAIFVTIISYEGFSSFAEIWRFDIKSGESTLIVENQNGSSQPLVSSPAPGPYGPVLHPNGSTLYYTSLTPRPYNSRKGASSQVFKMSLENNRTEPLVLENQITMKPAFTPDGKNIIYGAVRDGRTGLKIKELESGEERWLAYPIQRNQLESKATRDVLPNFGITSDSRELFAAWDGKIHRINLEDGGDVVVPFEAKVSLKVNSRLDFPRRIEQGAVESRRVQQLAISNDGRVAFSSLGRIWIKDVKGEKIRRLTAAERPREFMPAWSSDGNWISFITWDESGGHLWKARSDGNGKPIRLSKKAALWLDPAWSPDGASIVALRAPLKSTLASPNLKNGVVPDDSELMLISSESGDIRFITKSEGRRRPHFGPSSQRVYLSGNTLTSITLDGRETRTEAKLVSNSGPTELRLNSKGTHVLAINRSVIELYQISQNNSNDIKLASPLTIKVNSDSPNHVVWSGDGEYIMATSGVELQTISVDSPSESPKIQQLNVAVPGSAPDGIVALRNAKVITMNGYEIIDKADVVIKGNRILRVGKTGSVKIPRKAVEFDMSDKFIVPGFIDIHSHFMINNELPEPESTVSFANLAYGFTSLRNPQSSADIFGFSDMIEIDGVPAPRIFSTGPGLFSSASFSSPTVAKGVVEPYREKYKTHLLKWYLAGPRSERLAFIKASRELRMMPTTEGGADTKANITYGIDGFSGIEHAFPVAPIYDDLIQFVARTGITYTPTLVVAFGAALPIYRLLAEERPHENAKLNRWYPDGKLYSKTSSRLLWFPDEDYNDLEVAAGANEILKAGGRVALGGHGEIQGLSNHWEMELLARGGMSNHDVLRVATVFGAEAIGYEKDLGSVEPGKLADLVILDRNPLNDIAATQAIAYVMKNGVLYKGETLDEVWPKQKPLPIPWSMQRAKEPAAVVSNIEDLVRDTMNSGKIPGVAFAVIKEGEVLLAKGFGVANLETNAPVTIKSMFQTGSLGKQFTSAGIMALVEDGLIDLDGSVTKYISEAPIAWRPITIRHLLTHSSGIPDYTSEQFDYSKNYTEEDLVKMASELELEFAAGKRWNYSNTGYVMLGVVMSRITGMPYWDFLRKRIFNPAGMSTIRINTESDIVPHRARGYLPTNKGWQHAGYVAPMTNTTADGSMLLNLEDMIAWNGVVANRRILSEKSWDLILKPMKLNSGQSYPYGFGWFIDEVGGQIVHQHGGTWQGFTSQFYRFTGDNLVVILLTNARSISVYGLPRRIGALLKPSLAPEPPPSTPITDLDPVATQYIRDKLIKISKGDLTIEDFAFVRQTVFPRMRRSLTAQLKDLDAPDRMELLDRKLVGDDVSLQYWAWYGDTRFRVLVSLGPNRGLTALRLIPESTK